MSTAVNQLSNLTFQICLITLLFPTESFIKHIKSTQVQHQPFIGVHAQPKSDIAQLRPQLKPAKNKINYIFGTIGHRLEIQKAILVRIKFPIKLTNFYFVKKFFGIKLFLAVKLNKASAKLSQSGFF